MVQANGTLDKPQFDPSLPPNAGQEAVPHIQQFQAIINSISRVYRNPDEAYRNSRENARAMRRDLTIMEPLQARQMAVAELPWHIECEDKLVASELTKLIEEIPYFLQYKKSLLEAVWFGRFGVQNVYGWDYSCGQKRLCVKDWKPIHGDTLVFKWDTGQVGILVALSSGQYGTKPVTTQVTDISRAHFLTPWERESIVIAKHDIAPGDFFEPEAAGAIHGVGLRTYCYWTWYLKHEALGWLTEYMERVGLGIQLWYYDYGNPQSEKAVRQAAESQAFSNVILVPRFADQERRPMVERVEPGAQGADTLIRIIDDYFGRLIKLFIVGQQLTSETHATGLGSSVAEAHESTFARIIRYDAANLEETLTRDLVAVLLKYNFPNSRVKARFKINVSLPDPQQLLQAAKIYWDMSGSLDGDELRSLIGLSKPTSESEVLKRQPDETSAGFHQGMMYGTKRDKQEDEPTGNGSATPDFGFAPTE